MLRPSSAELEAAGAITNISDGTQFAVSGYGAEPTRESLATQLSASSTIMRNLREKSPGEYASVVDGFVDGYISGHTEAEVVAATAAQLKAIVTRWQPLADDAVVRDLWRLRIEQFRVLGTKNPALCYSFASGSGVNRNFSKDLPAALLQREVVLNERIIATAAARPAAPDATITPLWDEVFAILGKRLSPAELAALVQKKPDPSQYADYCSSNIAVIEEVMNLPRSDSALLLRSMLSSDH
jgi:hypothetical protein